MIRNWNRAAALSLIAALAAMPVSAQTASSLAVQNYPDRPIKLVSPFPPGGPTDVMARLIGGQMAKVLGQPVIIENRAGAAGAIPSCPTSRRATCYRSARSTASNLC